MKDFEVDDEREERIHNEVIVDAYDDEERAMGQYYYLEDQLNFPFKAKCFRERSISPLKKDDTVEVTGLPSTEECLREMFVQIKWEGRQFAVPLSQLEGIKVDESTQQGIEDWHYWVAQGYQF